MGSRRARAAGLVAAVVVAGAALGAGTAGADTASPADVLTAGLQKLVGTDGVIGAIGLVRNGSDSQYASAGYGDDFNKVAADPHGKFRIGSNTKAFTSTVILQLEAEHELSLDDTVEHWLPGVVDGNGYDGSRITIRELLNHTSGIPDYLTGPVTASYVANLNPNQVYPPAQLVATALQTKPLAAPGAAYSYSNTNYILAGMIIQAVTGDDPAAEIQNRIITPLGLTDTTFQTEPAMPAGHLNGYFHLHGSVFVIRDVTTSDVQLSWTAGAIVSTVDDLATFDRALITGRLLPPAQLRELETTVPTTDPATGYGLGIETVQTPCGPAFSHTGAELGYTSAWFTSPDGQRQTVVADNEYSLLAADVPNAEDMISAAENAYCATS